MALENNEDDNYWMLSSFLIYLIYKLNYEDFVYIYFQ